jgi:hypothetical protein
MGDTTTTTTALVLPRLVAGQRIADQDGIADPHHIQTLNNAFANILVAINGLASNEADLQSLVTQQQDILAQLVTINGLIVDVNGKLTNAAIANSYTDPTSVLTATVSGSAATIVIADHSRVYTDGMKVAVTGATLTGLAIDTTYYVFYSDPDRKGGTVSYQTTTDQTAAAQIGGIHSCGSIYTDSMATGPVTGGGTTPVGSGNASGPREALP